MPNSRFLFSSAVFLGSFLLFLVEPIAAKQLLPSLGGSAAVWITCLVFFQTALLCAYLYAHWLSRSSQWMLHFVLLALAAVAAAAWAMHSIHVGGGSERPMATVFAALSAWIGLPFLMLGATSPLMQVWWSRLQSTGIPYRLFALSNLASLLALGLYPSLIEPHLTLHAQRFAWACGFAVFAVVSAALTWKTRSLVEAASEANDEPELLKASLGRKLLWVLLPLGAAMQLSAVTSYLTANVAAIPLLWILPLATYLLTLILAFQFPGMVPRGIVTRLLIVMLGGLAYMLSQTEVSLPMRMSIVFFLVEVFVSCFFCHSEAYTLRPARASESTLFYLLFAGGGALGSFLIGIASPLVFRFNYDLAITFLVTALLALAVTWSGNWSQRLLWSVGEHPNGRAGLLDSHCHSAPNHCGGTQLLRHAAGERESWVSIRYCDAHIAKRHHSAWHAILRHRRTTQDSDHLLRRRLGRWPRTPLLLPGASAQDRRHRPGSGNARSLWPSRR